MHGCVWNQHWHKICQTSSSSKSHWVHRVSLVKVHLLRSVSANAAWCPFTGKDNELVAPLQAASFAEAVLVFSQDLFGLCSNLHINKRLKFNRRNSAELAGMFQHGDGAMHVCHSSSHQCCLFLMRFFLSPSLCHTQTHTQLVKLTHSWLKPYFVSLKDLSLC